MPWGCRMRRFSGIGDGGKPCVYVLTYARIGAPAGHVPEEPRRRLAGLVPSQRLQLWRSWTEAKVWNWRMTQGTPAGASTLYMAQDNKRDRLTARGSVSARPRELLHACTEYGATPSPTDSLSVLQTKEGKILSPLSAARGRACTCRAGCEHGLAALFSCFLPSSTLASDPMRSSRAGREAYACTHVRGGSCTLHVSTGARRACG